jgi:hypothetical protein
MLIFPLIKQWYEKIKSGEKTIEYREVKPYWTSRLISFYKENTEKDDDFHRYIVDWGNGFYDTEFYITPSKMFVDDLKTKFRKITFVNAYCQLRLGYTDTLMIARITEIEIVDGKDTDLAIDKPVYAIHLTDVKEDFITNETIN